ncbi:MAG TPA: glycosyltransferase [Gemmatimonadota bacterium]
MERPDATFARPAPEALLVIPVRDAAAAVQRTLRAALAARAAAGGWPGRIVVVDDGSDPAQAAALADAVRSAHAEPGLAGALALVRLPASRGPAAARNRGAREAGAATEVLGFLDADLEVSARAFIRARSRMASLPHRVAGVFGSYDDRPESPGFPGRFRNLLHHWIHQQGAGEAETFWAGLGFLRREAFDAAGGFDETFRAASIEDIELGLRLRDAGWALRLDPDLQGRHLKDWSLASAFRADVAHRAYPWTLLSLTRRRFPSTLNLAARQRLAAAGALALPAGLAAAAWFPPAATVAAAGLGAVVATNRGLYALAARRGGARFALAAVPLHLIHYLASWIGLLGGVAAWVGGRRLGKRVRGGQRDGRPGSRPPG